MPKNHIIPEYYTKTIEWHLSLASEALIRMEGRFLTFQEKYKNDPNALGVLQENFGGFFSREEIDLEEIEQNLNDFSNLTEFARSGAGIEDPEARADYQKMIRDVVSDFEHTAEHSQAFVEALQEAITVTDQMIAGLHGKEEEQALKLIEYDALNILANVSEVSEFFIWQEFKKGLPDYVREALESNSVKDQKPGQGSSHQDFNHLDSQPLLPKGGHAGAPHREGLEKGIVAPSISAEFRSVASVLPEEAPDLNPVALEETVEQETDLSSKDSPFAPV